MCGASTTYQSENFPLIDEDEGRITASIGYHEWGADPGHSIQKSDLEKLEAGYANIAPIFRGSDGNRLLKEYRAEITRLADMPDVNWGDTVILTLGVAGKTFEVGRFKMTGKNRLLEEVRTRTAKR